MTVGQLIERLQGMDSDLLVMVDGYEGQFDEVTAIGRLGVVFDPSESYFGEWRQEEKYDDPQHIKQAILLPRKS